jgi:hypothetical protein
MAFAVVANVDPDLLIIDMASLSFAVRRVHEG